MNDLFNNISEKNKQKLLDIFEAYTIKVPKNTTILSTVKPKNFVGIVISGYLQVIKNDYNGNNIVIEELDENMVFGNIVSAITNDEYDIIARENSEVTIIDFHFITENETSIPACNIFLKNLLSIMSNKINKNNNRIEILTNKTIRNKLLEYFKLMFKENNSKIIYLPFTFTNLADYLAVDRSAMSRELKNLKDEGLIEIKGKKIKLLYYVK